MSVDLFIFFCVCEIGMLELKFFSLVLVREVFIYYFFFVFGLIEFFLYYFITY